MNTITNGTATTIFGSESIEARAAGLIAVADFYDAVNTAFKECHDTILANDLTDERDDIERDVMEWTGEIKRLNDLLGNAYQNELRRLVKDKSKTADATCEADYRYQEMKDARLEK